MQRSLQAAGIDRQQGAMLRKQVHQRQNGMVKLPVITAVEIAPGIARRRSAYWHAIAETAIITAMPAVNPRGSVDTLVVTLKSRTAASSRN
jgi:hypothetical protein